MLPGSHQSRLSMDGIFHQAIHTCCCGVTANAYAHLTDHATKMWISFLFPPASSSTTTLWMGPRHGSPAPFNERLLAANHRATQPQSSWFTLAWGPSPLLPLVSNLIVTSVLDFVSSILLDTRRRICGYGISPNNSTLDLNPFADRSRQRRPSFQLLSAVIRLDNRISTVIFPATVPVQEYIQTLQICSMSWTTQSKCYVSDSC